MIIHAHMGTPSSGNGRTSVKNSSSMKFLQKTCYLLNLPRVGSCVILLSRLNPVFLNMNVVLVHFPETDNKKADLPKKKKKTALSAIF